MYLTDTTEIIINPSNYKHYSKFYTNIRIKDKIYVKMTELTKGSNSSIKVKCDNCGLEKELKYKNYLKNNYNGYYLCRMCKTIKNNLKKYGVEYTTQRKDVKEKSKKTLNEKYGVNNISQLEFIKRKKEETCLKNYGVKFSLSSHIIKEKSKKTLNEKYGVNNISQLEFIKRKKEETCLKNYGVDNFFKSEICREKLNNNVYSNIKEKYSYLKIKYVKKEFITMKCEKCNNNYDINYVLLNSRMKNNIETCMNCNPIGVKNSYLEFELSNFIKDNYNETIINNSKKIISPYELDIYLPKLNLAFEFNGVYWHSYLFKDKYYHKNKIEMCKKKNINLIHIWEDEWKYSKYLIKHMILNLINNNNNYKLLENLNKIIYHENEIIIDNSFSFLFKNYKLIYELEPIKQYVIGDKRIFKKTEISIYDSGYSVYELHTN